VVERWHGLHYERPLTRLHETITIVRQILSGSTVNLQGRIFQVSDFRLAIQPPAHTIPIYLAALGPKMVTLAGRIADGVLLYLCPIPKIPKAIADLREGANLAGRPSASIDVAAYLPTFVSEKGEEARSNVAASIAYYVGGMGTYYYHSLAESGFEAEANRIRDAWQRGDRMSATKQVTDQLLDSVALAGTPNECRGRLEEFRRAGVDLPILSFYIPNEKALQTVRDSIRSLTVE
jgi:alkanesulfonate monooxygenase SsuD/methylene tetrahydromethanopterin reductase-like flavin-dependent oxidoreductase (luciferase family)